MKLSVNSEPPIGTRLRTILRCRRQRWGSGARLDAVVISGHVCDASDDQTRMTSVELRRDRAEMTASRAPRTGRAAREFGGSADCGQAVEEEAATHGGDQRLGAVAGAQLLVEVGDVAS